MAGADWKPARLFGGMSHYANSIFARALGALARAVCRRPAWFVYPQIALFAVCVFYTVLRLKPDMNRDNLVGEKQRLHQVYLQFKTEFPGEDSLAVVVESADLELNRQFVERLAARVNRETNLFDDVFFKADIPAMGSKALLFFPESDLKDLRDTLKDMGPFVSEFTKANNLDSLFATINRMIRSAKREENAQNDALIRALPALGRILDQARDGLQRSGTPPTPGVYSFLDASGAAEQQFYITFAKGRIFLLTARPRNADAVEGAILAMRRFIRETTVEVPGVNAGLTGESVLDYDEMKQAEKDAYLATTIALVLCSLIFIYAYRTAWRPLKAVASLVIGLGYSMGFTTLAVGHVNILSITFAPILIGLAIDFGIHYITRYEEEVRNGAPLPEAVYKAGAFTGQGIVTGALTTAAAFLAMWLTEFKGIQEMGLISGGGLILCLIPMMTMLPALLILGKTDEADLRQKTDVEQRARVERVWLEHPRLICLATLILCGAAATQFHKVFFDYNLFKLQNPGLSSVAYMEKLLQTGAKSLIYGVVLADTPAQAAGFVEKINKLSSVETNDNMAQYLMEDQTRKLELLRDVRAVVAPMQFPPPDTADVNLAQLDDTLSGFMGYMGLAADEAEKEDPKLAQALRDVRETARGLRRAMADSPGAARRLAQYQTALFNDLRGMFDTLKNQDASGPLRQSDLPPSIRNRFIGVTGKQLIMVYPKKDIWDHENQAEFIGQLRDAVGGPERVTGSPVQYYEYTTLLKDSYVQAAWYSLIAICLMVLLQFRSFVCLALTLVPVVVGCLWTLGLMGLTGTPINPANIMTLPLVIGIGVTNGIQILNRFAEELKPGVLAKSTGKSVLVSGLTAIVGFGTFITAGDQGLKSLGIVMATGIAACMIAGLTVLPALLSILTHHGWTLRRKTGALDALRPENPPPTAS